MNGKNSGREDSGCIHVKPSEISISDKPKVNKDQLSVSYSESDTMIEFTRKTNSSVNIVGF